MPALGPTWFFINNKTTAKEFMKMCTKEDESIDKISMFNMLKTKESYIKEDDVIYHKLNEKDPVYVNVNHLVFKFPEFNNLSLESLAGDVTKDLRTSKNDAEANRDYMMTDWLEESLHKHHIPLN